MRTLIVIISHLLPLLFLRLLIMKSVDTQAFVPLIPHHDLAYSVTIGGPAPGAAGTPRKRGPLPPPTCGRGRLPTVRAVFLRELGPQLPWHNARLSFRNLLATTLNPLKRQRPGIVPAARRALATEAMVRLGMVAASPARTDWLCSPPASRGDPARPLAAALAQGHYFRDAKDRYFYVTHAEPNGMVNLLYLHMIAPTPADKASDIIVTGLSTPIRARELLVIIPFIVLIVLLGI